MSTEQNAALLPSLRQPWLWLAAAAVVLAAGVALHSSHAWSALLVAGVYGVQIALGALIWIAILSVSGAKWWLPARRHFLQVAKLLPVPVALVLVAATLGLTVLYPWAKPGAMEHSHLLHGKAGWLNTPFFIARSVVVVGAWLGLLSGIGRALEGWSQGSRAARARLVRLSAISLVVIALTISVAFWDWTMSLEPEWFSTMYGVYGFAGALQGGIAGVAALSIWLSRRRGAEGISANVRHDYGRLLFGFSMFWAYIWFCQYMLIWYADLPEEVTHYSVRLAGSWGFVFWLNPLLSFAVPFFVLLPAGTKRHEAALFQVSLLVVAARWLDVYLLVAPSLREAPSVPVYHAAALVLVFVGAIAWAQRPTPKPTTTPPSTSRARATAR